jgi:hypothetical protein
MGYAFYSYYVDFWCSDVPIDYPVIKNFLKYKSINFWWNFNNLLNRIKQFKWNVLSLKTITKAVINGNTIDKNLCQSNQK